MDFTMSEEKLINVINQCKGKVDWSYISANHKLSENFIEKFSDKVHWFYISRYQKLSETFIEKFSDKVYWNYISEYQKLSESFIEKFSDKVHWIYISAYQKLSESFIEKFSDKVHWSLISQYQKLSETFIEKFSDKVDWYEISIYQKLSENFIEKFSDKVNWSLISRYQNLSESFIKKHNLKIDEDSWLYLSGDEKLAKVKASKLYQIEGDYVLAYKGIRSDRYSKFNFQYQYLKGKTYECHADFNCNSESSFGLSAWTLKEATNYCNQLVVKVKIHKDDLAALVHEGGKIRCQKFTILENVA